MAAPRRAGPPAAGPAGAGGPAHRSWPQLAEQLVPGRSPPPAAYRAPHSRSVGGAARTLLRECFFSKTF